MKEIRILGTGCPKCEKLAAVTEQAAREMGIEYNLEKVKDLNEITAYGVMLTPALVVDGTVKPTGVIPSPEELREMLG